MHTILRMLLLVPMLALAACGPTPVREDRTQGLALELRWMSADNTRTSYYEVRTDGSFASSGGIRARDRATDFTLRLDDAETVRFVELVRATRFDERPERAGDAGDRSEVVVVDHQARRPFAVRGPDPSLDALLSFLRGLSMRQFRDVIDAQPVAGERRR